MNNKVEVFRPVILIKNYGFRVFQRKTEKVFFYKYFWFFSEYLFHIKYIVKYLTIYLLHMKYETHKTFENILRK